MANSNKRQTQGAISANFLKTLSMAGKTFFTIDDAKTVYGKNRNKTVNFIGSLVKRGLLARINAGTYLILQPGQENSQLNNWPLIAEALAALNQYFLSYYSAMRLHGMTTHPLLDAYITMTKRHRDKTISTISYHFIYCKPKHFWGTKSYWVTKQNKINISDLEKTILDGLDRPVLCGGIIEVVRGIWVKQHDIRWDILSTYAKKFHSIATIKRLGFILEYLNLGSICIPALKKIILHKKDYVFLEPGGSKECKYLASWYIKININPEELKASIWG